MNAYRRVSQVGFIISKGSEGSGSRVLSLASLGGTFSVAGAGRCTPPALTERWFYLPALFRPAKAAGAHPPGPRPTLRWWAGRRSSMDRPGDYPQQVSPMSVYNITVAAPSL